MEPFYYCRSEQYSKIARTCYIEFLTSKTFYDSGKYEVDDYIETLNAAINLSQRIDDNYVGAIVFEAMAVESYVNLMGAYLIGEKKYYEETNRKSTKEKISYVFEKIERHFPEDLLKRIGELFTKRNKLVHQKPQAIVIDIYNSDRETILREKEKLDNALFLDFNNIDVDIKLYDELKDTVKVARGAEYELIQEIMLKYNGEK